ncbi:hypothetical protein [Desertihabitans aurantiacus]|uniref:hypothetical protein n=1 Tax=Desertihabitans aurantiacus TaxID=2282477 RepID=UPI000DF8562F|nr:hypothetical protein [Desertihabitans aurantiacus]
MRRRLAALAVLPLLASAAACSQQPATTGEPPAGASPTPSAAPTEEELRGQLLSTDALPTDGWTKSASARPLIPLDTGDPCTGDPTALDEATSTGSAAPDPAVSAAFTRSFDRSGSGPTEDVETVIEILGLAPGIGDVVAQQREAWGGCTGEPIEVSYQPDVSAEPVELEAGVSAPACVQVVQGAGGATAVERFGHYCLVELSGDRVLSLYVEAVTDPAEETPDGERPTVPSDVEENFRSYLDAALTAAG